MSFEQVEAGACLPGSMEIGPFFQVQNLGQDWLLKSGCSKMCDGCKSSTRLALRRCVPTSNPKMFLMISASSAGPDGCTGGLVPYPDDDLVFMAVPTGGSFVEATRLAGCTPCGARGDLACRANLEHGRLKADLLCQDCSFSACEFPNVSELGGLYNVSNSTIGTDSGYRQALVITPQLFPLLEACNQNWPDDFTLCRMLVPLLCGLVAASLVCIACRWCGGWRRGWWRGWGRGGCRVALVDKDALCQEKHFHGHLLLSSILLVLCGMSWRLFNPLVNVLKQIEASADTANFDVDAATRIAESARMVGFWVFISFCFCTVAMAFCRLLWHHVRVQLGSSIDRPEGASTKGCRWRWSVVFLLAEASASLAWLSLVFWQAEFSSAFQALRHESDLSFLSGAKASAASTEFCIRILLCWVAPHLISLRVATSTMLFVASLSSASHTLGIGSKSAILGALLGQETIALVLTIAYFHSGYASWFFLFLGLLGTMMNGLWFCIGEMRNWAPFLCGAVSAMQLTVIGLMVWQMLESISGPFFLCVLLVSLHSSYSSTALRLRLETETGETISCQRQMRRRVEDARSDYRARPECISLLSQFTKCILEESETRQIVRYGARIKFRRLCLVLGSCGLCLSVKNMILHNLAVDPWEDMNNFIASMVGSGAVIAREKDSVLTPLVEQYGRVRFQNMVWSCIGASSFALAAVLDIAGSTLVLRGFWPSCARCLNLSRMSGFIGALAFACGLITFNLPDYVNLLDFGSLHLGCILSCSVVSLSDGQGLPKKNAVRKRCGSQFCKAVASSMKSAFGAGLLAKAGAEFLPLLVSLD